MMDPVSVKKPFRLCCLLLVFAAILLLPLSAGAETAETKADVLKLHCFSLGKADAFLLTNSDGAVLIDCGESRDGKEIVSYLASCGISELDALIITHFDKDHVGGAAKILKKIPVKAVYQSNCPKDSGEYRKYVQALSLLYIEPVTVRQEYTFSIGNAFFTIFPPEQERYLTDESNNSSLVTAVRKGERRLLFTGDCEGERLLELLETDPGHADLMQIPHHGKWQVQLPALLKAVAPDSVLITDSPEESADYMTIYTLRQLGIPALLTRDGAVDLTF